MSTEKTLNYNMNKWVGTDSPLREEFNANFEIIDNEMKSHASSLAEKTVNTDESRTTASKTVTGAINELNTNKAEKTEVNNALLLKRDKSIKIEQSDLSETLQGQILTNTFALNSIPAERSVSPNKTDFLSKKVLNMFDKVTADDGYLLSTDGTIVVTGYEQYSTSKFIPVSAGDIININNCLTYAKYDNNQTFLSAVDRNEAPLSYTVEAGVSYIKISILKTKLDSTMVVIGDMPTEYHAYADYTITVLDEKLKNTINANMLEYFISKPILPNQIDFLEMSGINLFDKTKGQYGVVNSGDGTIVYNETYWASGLIRVEEGQVCNSTRCYDGAYYDGYFNCIGGISSYGTGSLTITIPINAKYIRLTYLTSEKDISMFVKGNLPFKYCAYGDYEITPKKQAYSDMIEILQNKNLSRWAGKKWAVVGDSITEINDKTTKNYHGFIADKIGCVINNYGKSGTGYRSDYAPLGYVNICDRLTEIANDSDLITVFAGTNDVYYDLGSFGDTGKTTSIYGAIDYVCNTLTTMFPTKQIALFTPLPRTDFWGESPTNLKNIADAIIRVGHKYSIPVLDLYRESGLRPYNTDFVAWGMDSIGLHPNYNGHEIISHRILSFLNSI